MKKNYILNDLIIRYIRNNYVAKTHTHLYELFFWKEEEKMSNKRVESLMKLFEIMGVTDLRIPEEFENEKPIEELVHDWDGGVLYEVK